MNEIEITKNKIREAFELIQEATKCMDNYCQQRSQKEHSLFADKFENNLHANLMYLTKVVETVLEKAENLQEPNNMDIIIHAWREFVEQNLHEEVDEAFFEINELPLFFTMRLYKGEIYYVREFLDAFKTQIVIVVDKQNGENLFRESKFALPFPNQQDLIGFLRKFSGEEIANMVFA